MKLVSFKICPFVQRIAALLEAKQLAYQVEYISLDNSPDWFLALSPNAQVPLLITDSGQALFESEAIAEYLDEISPPLEPDLSPEQKALDRAWGYQASNLYLLQCATMRSTDRAGFIENQKTLEQSFRKIEDQLIHGPFFKGNILSNPDMAWLPLLHRAEIIRRYSGYDFFNDFPKLQAWQQHLMELGLADKSVSKDFESVFSDFYLSESTYLGQQYRSKHG